MPTSKPGQHLPSTFDKWNLIATNLPQHYANLDLRQTIDKLPLLEPNLESLPDEYLLRAAQVLAMLAHAYFYVETTPPKSIPEAITKPWSLVRARLGREQEVLSYIDLIVYNWKFVDETLADPFRVKNMQLLMPTVDNQEERGFYLTQTEILAQCGPIVGAVVRAQEAVANDDPIGLEIELEAIIQILQIVVRDSLVNINPNKHAENYVDPVVWAKTVAPFAVPIKEGLQGPSGTSSPVFNLLDAFLGRKQFESFLGKEILMLRHGYPQHWRNFLTAVEEVSITDYIIESKNPRLTALLKDAVENYAGEGGFLGRHRMKVYGYLEIAFKVGRSMTIGGFSGLFKDRTWDQVDSELELARRERLERFPSSCHYAFVKSVGQTHTGGPEGVKHVVLEVKGGVRYEPGDRCGILPENSNDLIQKTLSVLGAAGDKDITLTEEWRDAVQLRWGYDRPKTIKLKEFLKFGRIRPVEPRAAEALHALTQNKALLTAIKSQTTIRWELWDLINKLKSTGFDASRLYQSHPDSAEYIANVVAPESFRFYSISSTFDPHDPGTEIHLTVGKIRYTFNEGGSNDPIERFGTASNYLASTSGFQHPIPVMISHPQGFNLPRDPSIPIVMIGGGTGIAPFRSFIEERLRQEESGLNWLLLSLQSREYFYYNDEFLPGLASDRLKLDIAFTRDDIKTDFVKTNSGSGEIVFKPGQRQHVDSLLLSDEIAKKLWDLLRSKVQGGMGAHLYICGRTRFAKSVQDTLVKLFDRFIDKENCNTSAKDMLAKMTGEGRYVTEVFSASLPWDAVRDEIPISEIVLHNNEDEGYWLIIDGLVYDLTDFSQMHPGGARVLRGYAGYDASQGFQRAHKSSSEIRAMMDMYEVGAVKHLEFGVVTGTVQRDSGPQTVSLAALYRVWVSSLFLAVEMQNALINDQDLQVMITTRDDPAYPRSFYKLQRAVETQERFLKSYANGVAEGSFQNLWTITQGLCTPGRNSTWMKSAIEAVQRSEPAKYVEALTEALKFEIQNAIKMSPKDSGALQKKLAESCEILESFDREFLEEIKGALRNGVEAFEIHESETLSKGRFVLMSILRQLPSFIEKYYRNVQDVFMARGWQIEDCESEISIDNSEDSETLILLANKFWTMEENAERGYVVLARSAEPIKSIEEFISLNDQIIAKMRADHKDYGIVVDMRQAPPRNDPDFENAMHRLRLECSNLFSRVAVLLESSMGVLQVNRLARNENAETLATTSESSAIYFAKGAA